MLMNDLADKTVNKEEKDKWNWKGEASGYSL